MEAQWSSQERKGDSPRQDGAEIREESSVAHRGNACWEPWGHRLHCCAHIPCLTCGITSKNFKEPGELGLEQANTNYLRLEYKGPLDKP